VIQHHILYDGEFIVRRRMLCQFPWQAITMLVLVWFSPDHALIALSVVGFTLISLRALQYMAGSLTSTRAGHGTRGRESRHPDVIRNNEILGVPGIPESLFNGTR
jgi:hypothetical protein